MEIISTFAAGLAMIAALLTTSLIAKKLIVPSSSGRFVTIDGLRGYLAFFVFLHHSCIWYYFLKTGVWETPPNRLFVHFGQGGVALFFMITGFLFFSKLLDDRQRGVDWTRLYVSRFLRLTPLYFFSMALLFLIVAFGTMDQPLAPLSEIIIVGMKWLSFRIFGGGDLNGFTNTSIINAGVTWSLPYEWTFYMVLPLLALCLRLRPPVTVIAISIFSVVIFGFHYLTAPYYWLFLGGIGAAIVVRNLSFQRFSRTKWATALIVGLVFFVVINYSSLYDQIEPKFLLMVVFSLIAGGNSVFGVLNLKLSRVMGEMAYSIYLLHGIILFVMFKFVLGAGVASQLSPFQYWSVIVLLTPIVILSCSVTFLLIEKPSMKQVAPLTAWITSKKSTLKVQEPV